MNPKRIIDQIQRVRARNNVAWMDLVRLAWEVNPKRAKAITRKITANDGKILELSKKLARLK